MKREKKALTRMALLKGEILGNDNESSKTLKQSNSYLQCGLLSQDLMVKYYQEFTTCIDCMLSLITISK